MFGFGVEKQMSWPVLFVAYGFINTGITGVASIGMTYVMDAYFPVAADALLVVNGFKNVIAFGFTYGVVPWVTKSGYASVSPDPVIRGDQLRSLTAGVAKTFGTMAGIYIAVLLLAVPLALYGRPLRHYTSSHWRLVWIRS
jgi:hypothetical protein